MGDNPDAPSSKLPAVTAVIVDPAVKPKRKAKAAPIAEPAEVTRDRVTPMLAAALAYSARGWPVFPCSPQTKSPLLPADRDAKGDKIRGTGGVSKATLDPDLIRGWWHKWPNAMIGVAMGRNGLFVVDFDPRTDPDSGEEFTLERLKGEVEAQMGCPLPASLAVRTQSGGVHVYLRQPDDGGDMIRNRGNLPLHVDVRGLGGYVIAPPSVMTNGREYRWLRGDAAAEPVDAPAELIAILRAPKAGAAQTNVGAQAPAPSSSSPSSLPPPSGGDRARPGNPSDAEDEAVRRYAAGALVNEVDRARRLGQGQRNAGISACALALGHFIGAGLLSKGVCLAALTEVAEMWPDVGKTVASITSGLDKGASEPIDVSRIRAEAREKFERNADWERRQASRARPSSGPDGGEAKSFRGGTIGHDSAAGGVEDGDDLGMIDGQSGVAQTASERAREKRKLHAALSRYNRTDLGNAERFRDRFGQDFRFTPELGWFGWDKRRWKLLTAEANQTPGEVLQAVFKMVRDIRREAWVVRASGVPDADKNPDGLDRTVYDGDGKPKRLSAALLAWAETSEANARLKCVAGLVRPWLTVKTDEFDKDLYAFNVMNGTLRFRRERGPDGRWLVAWKLFKHDRRDLLTKLSPVAFDKAAKCPVYDGLLDWAQPDPAMRRYLHQWGGLSLTGETGEQKLHFWHGGGGNGKGTIINAWYHVVGDYGGSTGIATFLEQGAGKSGDKPTPDLAKLPGVRLLRISEPRQKAQLAEDLIKLVTGQDPLDARHLNKGFFSYLPHFKMTILGNHWLGIKGTDKGIWRRVKLIPWDQSIDEKDKDETLPDQLKAEASGILNRLLAGLLDWMRNGLAEPKSVTDATAAYREASDPLGRFLSLCTRPKAGARVQSSRLHAVYEAWCKAAGETAWKNKGMAQAMLDKGFKKKASDGMQWLDIELIRVARDFVDDDGNAIAFSLPDEPEPPPRAIEPGGGWNSDDDDVPY
jgi:putative DNA primase/helicase